MNIRNIALVAALVSVAAVSNAQVFELRAGAGVVGYDAATRTFKVQPGQAFTINIVAVNNTATTYNQITTASVGLAFDRVATATQGNSRTNALGVDKKLSVDYSGTSWGAGITSNPAYIYPTVTLTEGGTANLFNRPGFNWTSSLAGSNITAFRPLALSGQAQITTPGVTATWAAGSELAVMSVRMNNTLAIGEIYGDDNLEAGLQMWNGTPGTTVNFSRSGFAGVGASVPGTFGSVKYRVEAVPEPMTMAALGAGLALMARRRRKS